ncbi:MAG: hypothetical protein DRO52_05130 [Candidatus Hecatellales archaeon]|nr:MAG: hypothetical protein DRO52_05130 [Candidatus Hecatellales archaeon]
MKDKLTASKAACFLWICPICQGLETLKPKKVKKGFLKTVELVECSHCGSRWLVEEDWKLTLLDGEGNAAKTMHLDDWWRELTERFRMKLKPTPEAGGGIVLKPGEEAYAVSGRAKLFRLREYKPGGLTGVTLRGGGGIYVHQFVGGVTTERAWRLEAEGFLHLTNRRLVFAGVKGFTLTIPLERIVRVDATWRELVVASDRESYLVRFEGESQFKWRWLILTMIGMLQAGC